MQGERGEGGGSKEESERDEEKAVRRRERRKRESEKVEAVMQKISLLHGYLSCCTFHDPTILPPGCTHT